MAGSTADDQLPGHLRISSASSAHEEVVLGLMREFYAAEQLEYREDVARTALRELWLSPRTGLVFLLNAGDALIGYAILTFGFSLEFRGRDALVDELYVRQQFRSRGYGGSTLAWLEEVCRAEGIHALHLEVDHANPAAKRLYNRVGFIDHDRHLLTKRLDGSPLKPRPNVIEERQNDAPDHRSRLG
jgi:GNAT superfamily N-acetyltransferase